MVTVTVASADEKDRLRRGVALAWFIHQDRTAAEEFASRAFAKHEIFVANQVRYQDYSAPQRRTKVQLTPTLFFQYLILNHSADRQLAELTAGSVTRGDTMLVYFFAFVAFTLFRTNSFRATAAMGRLLLRLSAEETRELYYALYQEDRDRRERGDDEVNREKKNLYDRLIERFGAALTPEQVHLEKTFKQQTRTECIEELAGACLEQFAHWRDRCVLAVVDRPVKNISHSLDPDDAGAERDRMHVALHCLRNLAKMVLGLDRVILIPQFACASSPDDGPSSLGPRLQPPEISETDYQRLIEPALLQRHRRRTTLEPLLHCKVDGELTSIIDLRQSAGSDSVTFTDSDEYLEVWAADVLLAIYELPGVEDLPATGALRHSIKLEGGQRLTFSCSRLTAPGRHSAATLLLDYRETRPARFLWRWFDHRRSALRACLGAPRWQWGMVSTWLILSCLALTIGTVWTISSIPKATRPDASLTTNSLSIVEPGDQVLADLDIQHPRSISGYGSDLSGKLFELAYAQLHHNDISNPPQDNVSDVFASRLSAPWNK